MDLAPSADGRMPEDMEIRTRWPVFFAGASNLGPKRSETVDHPAIGPGFEDVSMFTFLLVLLLIDLERSRYWMPEGPVLLG